MTNPFCGRVAIVTGASTGIGRAVVLALAKKGVCNVLASRNLPALEETAAQVRALGAETLILPTDVTDPEQVDRMVRKTLALWGKVDYLISNAGQYLRTPIKNLTVQRLKQSMEVNFYGHVRVILAVLPSMVERKAGHIVLVSSADAKKALPPDAPYASAEFALSGFGEVLRQELHGSGVHVTTVYPGRVDTAMIEGLRAPRMSAKIPPERVAQAILDGIARRKAEVVLPTQVRLLNYLNVFFPFMGDWTARTFQLQGWDVRDERHAGRKIDSRPLKSSR